MILFEIIGRTSATELLTGIKGGGALEKYLGVKSLEAFIDKDLVLERLVPFRLLEVEGLERAVKGLPAELMIEICQGFVAALQASFDPNTVNKLTGRQQEMAIKASMFLSACAKVGLEALIDEATGYQYERAEDALQVKLRAFIAVNAPLGTFLGAVCFRGFGGALGTSPVAFRTTSSATWEKSLRGIGNKVSRPFATEKLFCNSPSGKLNHYPTPVD